MASRAASHVALLPGVPTFGLWCPHCSLPSGCLLRWYAFTVASVRCIATLRRCLDCGADLAPDT